MPIPHPYIEGVVRELQIASERIASGDLAVARDAFNDVARGVPDPPIPAERLLLRVFLLDFACGAQERLHALRHGDNSTIECAFPGDRLLSAFVRQAAADPRGAFVDWSKNFLDALRRTHPPSAASQAAQVIRRQTHGPLNVPAVARDLHTTRTQLHRAFCREFGMSLREYHQLARLLEALDRVVEGEKIEAIAVSVGYRSKKNFYRAFHKLTGLTPTEFRSLPADHRSYVAEGVRLRIDAVRIAGILRRPTAEERTVP
jgi:AraC-like DNA-binding protein